jgi:hypothetical protein
MSQTRGMNVQDVKEIGTVGGIDTTRGTNSLSGYVSTATCISVTKEINWYNFLPFDYSFISLWYEKDRIFSYRKRFKGI